MGTGWWLEGPEAWAVDNTDPSSGQDGTRATKALSNQERLAGNADLAFKPAVVLGRAELTDEAPRLEAVLGKTRRTEF